MERIFLLYRLKSKNISGNKEKYVGEHKESDADHIAMLCILAQYFLPEVNAQLAESGLPSFSLKEVVSIILAHDAAEGITSDIANVYIQDENTKLSKAEAEEKAEVELMEKYLAHNGDLQNRYAESTDKYKTGKVLAKDTNVRHKNKQVVGIFVKALDALEANLHLINPETIQKHKVGKARFKPMAQLIEDHDSFIKVFKCVYRINSAVLEVGRKQSLLSTQ